MPASLWSLFRVFWKAWCRQISHSVIQTLCIAWGLFCISNVIRKSLTEKWSPLQHPHLEMSSICYKSLQFGTNDFTQNLAKSYRRIQDGALGRSITKNCPNLSTFSRWCFLVAFSSVRACGFGQLPSYTLDNTKFPLLMSSWIQNSCLHALSVQKCGIINHVIILFRRTGNISKVWKYYPL